MSPDSPDRARSTAVEQLRSLGLSTYAARTFVALVELGEGTARDVSDVADVPRTRVYDAVQDARVRRRPGRACTTPSRTRVYDAVELLTEAIDSRVAEFVSTADEEVVYTTVGKLLTDDLPDRLRAAADRGVAIGLAGMSPAVEREIGAALNGLVVVLRTMFTWELDGNRD